MGNRSVNSCIIIIGNEILSGRTQDKNLVWLADILNKNGVQVQESRIIPDVHQTIVDTVNHCRKRFDYVITTGGIGPTHDDITTACIADAFGVKLLIHPDIEAMIRQKPASKAAMEARMRMAMIPEGAELVHSKMGPPGYKIGNVFVLAGIPSIMQSMSKSLVKMISGGLSVQSYSEDAYLTESAIAGPLKELQDNYPDISLGSYPFYKDNVYGTSLVMRGTDLERLDKVRTEIRQLIASLDGTTSS